ncbi:formate dehydrogenase accessory protein [Cupriavidus basilensis OR16]|uniref:Formate dehydrogenase accessory protein n=1 Tax=Cupriavidus basilensis OR16 TaxID=1127483 RepID=H1RYI7_9BURK|nr:formate dehydrogenase accessory protein [Cupriavidus basilensis OR16]
MRRDVPGEDSGAGIEDVPTQRSFAVRRWRHGTVTAEEDRLAEELPVALEYNGISHAVMLAPGRLHTSGTAAYPVGTLTVQM